MTEDAIANTHRRRFAFVYLRQSSPAQVERNQESTRRQYALAGRAQQLGWRPERIQVIDEDLGLSGRTSDQRKGFQRLTAEVALGHAGLVLGLEVSRLARNNADWYRLIEVCALTHTLLGDADGIYNPADFNDRLLLGIKGTLSEVELHTLKQRLLEGARSKAARGALRMSLPIGLVWGEEEGEIRLHPDEEVVGAIRLVFRRFAELGSMRRVWVWFREEGLRLPIRRHGGAGMSWQVPSYSAIVLVLKNPVYAGAYAYGKRRRERYLDAAGRLRTRVQLLPPSEWRVLILNHHPGYIDWNTYEANQARIRLNAPWKGGQKPVGGCVREGRALLQGLGRCGRCGRGLRTAYNGGRTTPSYFCPKNVDAQGRSDHCLRIGAVQVDKVVAASVLEVVSHGAAQAVKMAREQASEYATEILAQQRLVVERASYDALRAERAYRAVDPENRRVARSLEREGSVRNYVYRRNPQGAPLGGLRREGTDRNRPPRGACL